MTALDIIDYFSYIVAILLTVIFGGLSLRQAGRQKGDSLLFYLLTGFFTCIFISNLFYLLTWTVEDYPFVFSPGDLSWVGGIFFLITASLWIYSALTPEQAAAVKKYRLPALTAPALCAAFNCAFILIYPDILFNYLLYGVPTAILSYHTLRFYLAGRKNAPWNFMRRYPLAVLLWIAVQLFYDLFSVLGWNNGYAVPYELCVWFLLLSMPFLYLTAKRGTDA